VARKKPLADYPHEYSVLVSKGTDETVTIACDSNAQAVNLRNDLYAFRQVLYDDPTKKELSDAAQNCRFLITDATLTVEPIRSNNHGTKDIYIHEVSNCTKMASE